MDTSFQYDQDYQCIMIRVGGDLSKDGLLSLIAEVYRSDWYQPYMNEIWDFTRCNYLRLSEADLVELEGHETQNKSDDTRVRAALVAERADLRLLLERYCKIASSKPYQVKAFAEFQAAYDWIQEARP